MSSRIIRGCFIIYSGDPSIAIDVYVELLKTVNVPMTLDEDYETPIMIISDLVFDQVMLWQRTRYAGLSLSEFMDSLYAK